MKKTLLSVLFAGALTTAQAQDIVFSTFMSEYTPIENGTNAIGEAWDDPSFTIPLGFDITIMGQTSNSAYMNDFFLGGIIGLGEESFLVDAVLGTTADLTDPEYFNSGTLSAPITYATTGTPGNRICKIQWENAGFYDEVSNGSANNLMNLQVWIYEVGVIEVHHGPNTIKEPEIALAFGWTAGLIDDIDLMSEDGDFTNAYIVSGNPESPTFINSSNPEELFLVSLEAIPSNGRVYRFGPDGAINTLEFERDELRLWPLTANEVINLSAGTNGIAFYDVYDLSGKIVAHGNFSGTYTLPVSHMQTGIYLVNLRTENNAHTFKVVKR
jgi:hypothetical protein